MAVERFDQSPSSPSGEHSPAPSSPLPASLKGTLTGRETIPPENLPDFDDQHLPGRAETSAGRIGRYQLIGILGQGAMGIVYLAHDPDNQRQVALKLPKFGSTSGADNIELLQRFYREARATGNLDHPNICRVYDVGQSDGTHYIAMAYIEGRSLAEYLDRQELIPQPQAATLVRKLADALQHAHGRGIVHRDLKPGNIMLDVRGEPIVMDFGLACETAVTGDIRLTQSGSILGSPAYMSPEQADGQIKKIGPLSDLYSLGVILYELLTGQLPFRGSIAAVLAQILTRDPRPPSALRPDVDPLLELICLKMMAKRPSDRFTSMQQVVETLDGYLTRAAPATRSLGLRPELVGTESQPTNRAPAAASVVASLADEQLVKARKCQQAIARARREGNLEPAIRYLKQLATSKSAKIAEYVRWAQQELPKVEAELDRVQREAREQCAAACEKARTLINDHDYAGALQALELVTVTARTHEHAQLLSEVNELTDECSSLRQEIDDAVQRKKYDRLAPLVKRYLKLKPDTPKMQRLLRDLAKNRPARAVAKFKGNRKYLDVAGRLVEPKELVLSVIAILALFATMSYFMQSYLANRERANNVAMSAPDPRHQLLAQQAQATTPNNVAMNAPSPAAAPARLIQNSLGMELVLIEPGEFLMGAPDSEAHAKRYEKPQHRVQVSEPFYIGKYEVTQAEYEQVTGTNPSHFASSGTGKSSVANQDTRRFPVEMISWNDAVDFCNKLSERDGLTACYDENRRRVSDRGYRLPTEAEWEYACRAGTTTPFHFGNALNGDQANVNGTFPYGTTTRGRNLPRTTAVDDPKYPLNAFGLAQMHGNVWEWCEDVYDENVYAGRSDVTTNPVVTSGSPYRVLRGSSWVSLPWDARAAFRYGSPDLRTSNDGGFRVVCSSGAGTISAKSRPASDSTSNAPQTSLKPAPDPGSPPDRLMKNSIDMELVLIEPGAFLMGSSDADVQAALQADRNFSAEYVKAEQPQHRVRLTQPFYMGKYEVTQSEYQQVMGTNPSYFASSGGGKSSVANQDSRRFPVDQVSWNDAVDFCNKLSERDGLTACYDQNRQRVSDRGYRLPTEAEWEYACRAGTTTPFHFGSVLNGDKANVHGHYPYGTTTKGTYLARTAAVDDPKYPPNVFGLAQMHGNVWEWCEDVWDDKVYAGRSGVTTNPVVTSGSASRVMRGGSWVNGPGDARSAARGRNSPDLRSLNIGFRVVCVSGARTR